MSRVVLLGDEGTKRTVFLEKGAKEAGIRFDLVKWKDFQKMASWKNIFLKIDPPLWENCRLEEMERLTEEYKENLRQLEKLGKKGNITFLNSPESIQALLNKRGCKKRLKEVGLPVTEALKNIDFIKQEKEAGSFQKEPAVPVLLEAMEKQRIFQVFIKPNQGSGAAGAAAFCWQPRTGQMILYTCGMEDPLTHGLVNTKRLRKFTDRDQVVSLLERLLGLEVVVERWYAKAKHQGFSYDLRAVVQDGQLDFVLARLSSGPITNLHLNNHPLKGAELGLSPSVWNRVTTLCQEASTCYPGLRSVGIDILLERGSLRPRIIEMNGQGDLIYQDIYEKNVIYRHQAEMMREWLWKNQR